MVTRWNQDWTDFDSMFSAMQQLSERMDRIYADGLEGRFYTDSAGAIGAGGWPRANLVDAGALFVLTAEVPGLSEKDIKLMLNQDVLTISGARAVEVPSGYSTHRRERSSVNFSRSFALPCPVNADKTTATVKNGILTVTCEKAAEAMPRQITVGAGN